MIEIQPRSASARGQSDPLFYVNSNTPSPTGLTCNDMETTPGQSTSFQETVSPFSRMTSALGALTLTPEQSLKALEFAVLCAEYGTVNRLIMFLPIVTLFNQIPCIFRITPFSVNRQRLLLYFRSFRGIPTSFTKVGGSDRRIVQRLWQFAHQEGTS